jgi:hypothetical protein
MTFASSSNENIPNKYVVDITSKRLASAHSIPIWKSKEQCLYFTLWIFYLLKYYIHRFLPQNFDSPL